MPLLLEIVTPEKKVYSKSVESVSLPTPEGEIGILPGHLPLITLISPGYMETQNKEKKERLAVDKGFVEVLGDKVSVLTEGAIDLDTVDLSAVTKAQERAQKALSAAKEKNRDRDSTDIEEIERLEKVIRFSAAQKLAKSRKS